MVVPVIMQRRCVSRLWSNQIQFIAGVSGHSNRSSDGCLQQGFGGDEGGFCGLATFFALLLVELSAHFSEPSMTKSSLPSRVPMPLSTVVVDKHTRLTSARVWNNDNNNTTIWGGSVLTGEEPPPHSGELKHALPQAGGPTQSQLSRPMPSGHHISMEHRRRRKQLNSNTNASHKKIFERDTRKKKRRNFFSGKKWKKKMKNSKKSNNEEMNKKREKWKNKKQEKKTKNGWKK